MLPMAFAVARLIPPESSVAAAASPETTNSDDVCWARAVHVRVTAAMAHNAVPKQTLDCRYFMFGLLIIFFYRWRLPAG